MKKILFLFLLSFISLSVFSQNMIGYGYDKSGNRIRKEIIMPAQKNAPIERGNNRYSESLKGHSIRINTNPSQGMIHVAVAGMGNDEACNMAIYSANGQLISCKDDLESFDFYIGNQPPGVYILNIAINGNTTTWKITKQ